MNEPRTPRAPSGTPAEAAWPFFYETEIGEILDRLDQGLSTTVVRGARGAGKTSVLRELHRRRGGVFVQGRDPGMASDLLDRARDERAHLFVDDLDYLLDPERERVSGESGEATGGLEKKARFAIEFLRQRGCAVVVAYMYPDRRFDVEYSGTISNLWQIGEKQYLPLPWSHPWEQRLKGLLREPGESLRDQQPNEGPYSLMVGGVQVPVDDKFAQVWGDQVLAHTGGHPTLVAASMRGLVADAEPDAKLPTTAKKLARGELVTRVRQWLELTLAGEALNPVRLRLAALRNSDRRAFALLIRAAQSGGGVPLSVEEARSHRDILENECLAFYDGREGCLHVVGQAIRNEIMHAFGAASPLIPDPEQPEERGMLMVASPTGSRPLTLTGQPWQVLKLLYERGGGAVPSTEIKNHIKASTPGAVRAIIQRLSTRLAAAGLPGLVENSRRTGYYLVMKMLER